MAKLTQSGNVCTGVDLVTDVQVSTPPCYRLQVKSSTVTKMLCLRFPRLETWRDPSLYSRTPLSTWVHPSAPQSLSTKWPRKSRPSLSVMGTNKLQYQPCLHFLLFWYFCCIISKFWKVLFRVKCTNCKWDGLLTFSLSLHVPQVSCPNVLG